MLFTFTVMTGLAIGLNSTLSIDSTKKNLIGAAIGIGIVFTIIEVILFMNQKHNFGWFDKAVIFINSACLLVIGAALLSENDTIQNDATLSNGIKTVYKGTSITSVVLGGLGILIMVGYVVSGLRGKSEPAADAAAAE